LIQVGIDLLLVISDYQMPGMKGDEFAQTLKTKLPEVNILLLTGQISEEKTLELLDRNIILKVLQKPWKEKDLMNIITSISNNAE
jgi:CheY-like chemotaxis protein